MLFEHYLNTNQHGHAPNRYCGSPWCSRATSMKGVAWDTKAMHCCPACTSVRNRSYSGTVPHPSFLCRSENNDVPFSCRELISLYPAPQHRKIQHGRQHQATGHLRPVGYLKHVIQLHIVFIYSQPILGRGAPSECGTNPVKKNMRASPTPSGFFRRKKGDDLMFF